MDKIWENVPKIFTSPEFCAKIIARSAACSAFLVFYALSEQSRSQPKMYVWIPEEKTHKKHTDDCLYLNASDIKLKLFISKTWGSSRWHDTSCVGQNIDIIY